LPVRRKERHGFFGMPALAVQVTSAACRRAPHLRQPPQGSLAATTDRPGIALGGLLAVLSLGLMGFLVVSWIAHFFR
jgi:hypothetical protein